MLIAILAGAFLFIAVAALPTWRQVKSLRAALRQPEPCRDAVSLRNASEYGTNIPFWLRRWR